MEQKIYNYEAILNLLRGENHLRQIAKELDINHMTIKRALDLLVKQNVLDVKEQGRNNVFTIKNTLEAQCFVFIAEKYRFNMLINKHPELKQDIKELIKLPVGIIAVFGSYAKGNETKESDVDIYIDTSSKKIKEKAKIQNKFSIKTGNYDRKSLLIKEIEKNHVIIKGVEAFYEKNRFFEQIE